MFIAGVITPALAVRDKIICQNKKFLDWDYQELEQRR